MHRDPHRQASDEAQENVAAQRSQPSKNIEHLLTLPEPFVTIQAAAKAFGVPKFKVRGRHAWVCFRHTRFSTIASLYVSL